MTMTRLFPFVALLCLCCSCAKEPLLVLDSPEAISFNEQGGTRTVSFSTNHDWEATSSSEWLKVSPQKGRKTDGEVSITLTCDPNAEDEARNAVVTIRSKDVTKTVNVTQNPRQGILVLEKQSSYSLDCKPQRLEITVITNVEYAVDIDAQCKDWILPGGTRALSSDNLVFNITANDSPAAREGWIVIRQTGGELSQTITIKQSAYDASDYYPYVLLTFSSRAVQPIQLLPESARWTIFWGDGLYSYRGSDAGHSYVTEGIHEVMLSGSEITEFSTSVKGLEMIDLSNF